MTMKMGDYLENWKIAEPIQGKYICNQAVEYFNSLTDVFEKWRENAQSFS